jgi:hypothetical protein
MKNRIDGAVKHKVNVIKNPNTWIIGAIFLVLFALHYDQIVPILSQINILTVFGRKAHSLQRTLFIIPIAYVGYVFGLRAGITALVVVYLGILPRVFFLSENPNDEFWEATLAWKNWRNGIRRNRRYQSLLLLSTPRMTPSSDSDWAGWSPV